MRPVTLDDYEHMQEMEVIRQDEYYQKGWNDAIQACLSLIGNHAYGDHSGNNEIKSLFGCLKKADIKGNSGFKTAMNWYKILNKELKKLRK